MRRDIRPYVYAAFDAVMAAIYALLLAVLLPGGHRGSGALLWGLVACQVAVAGAMLVRRRWGWRIAAGGCGLLLLLELALIVVLVMSAAFLAGVYGSYGRGAAMMTLLVVVLSFQLIALLPALQLKYLMTRAGRRHYQLEPLGK